MPRTDHITGPAFLLVAGRTIGLIATFAIGPLFARKFDLADNGTYGTFFLIYATVYGLAQLGMAESLYYFLPRANAGAGPESRALIPRYVCNAAITLAAAGLASIGLLWIARGAVAEFFGNPAVSDFILPLGLFVTLMLVGTVLEITLVSRKQHGTAAVAYAISDIVRTAFFVLPALIFVSLRAVFIGAVAFAAVRLAAMLVMLWRQFGHEFRPDAALWRTQLAYALPFALAVGIEVVLVNYHTYVVGGSFDTETLAIYIKGVLAIPLVDLIMTSTTSVMMVKMADGTAKEDALGLFHDTVARLAFLLLPLAVGLTVLAHPFILMLFTDKFAGSIPVFMVWVLTIVPMTFAVDAMLRAHAQTRFLLVMNLVRFAVLASTISWFIGRFGLPGAVMAALAALVASKGLGLLRVAQVMRVPVTQVVPWATLGRLALRAGVAAVPAWMLASVFAHAPGIAFTTGSAAYGLTYLVLCYAPGIAEPAAIRLPIVERFREWRGVKPRPTAVAELHVAGVGRGLTPRRSERV